MARPELGTKYTCTSCEAKFYDLNRVPFSCPKCGEVYSAAPVSPSVVKKPVAPAEAKPKEAPVVKKSVSETDAEDVEEAEIDEELLADVGIDDDDDDETDDTGVLIVDADEDTPSVSDIVPGGKPDKETT